MPITKVRTPSGEIVQVIHPEGATDEEIIAYAKANAQPQPKEQAAPKAEQMPATLRAMSNLAAGGIRGAGSIGATLLASPAELRQSFLGQGGADAERRKSMDDALQSFGFDPSSGWFKGGKLAGEVGGTAGVGPAASILARYLGAGPAVVQALSTAGMTTGRAPATVAGKTADMALRSAAGGAVGFGSAGLVNPEEAGTGGMVGVALPPALKAAGAGGRAAGLIVRTGKQRARASLVDALDAGNPAAVAAELRATGELVPGSRPTVAQILRTPQAAILEDVVGESAGGAALKQRYLDQNAARLNLLEQVAATDPRGFRSAQQDTGEAIIRYALGADAAARKATREAFESIPMDQASLYLPDLAAVRDKYFGPASTVSRDVADRFVNKAREIGFETAPGIVPKKAGKAPKSLAQAVRKDGGIGKSGDLAGEVRAVGKDLKNLIRKDGKSADMMAERMREAGYIGDEGGDDLMQALADEARGRQRFSNFDMPTQQWEAAREAAMGAPPGAAVTPRKVTLRDVQDMARDLKAESRGMAGKPELATQKAALDEMAKALDDRIDEVIRGDGAIDENLPVQWALDLDKARALKRQQVETFRTGPQAAIFRRGSDGMPLVQGGELMAKTWGSRPGVAEDVAQLRKMIDANQRLLGQFRSMVTTEGASTASQGGNLTGKFVRWVENTLPGLKATFEPEQVRMFERIAADIKRGETARAARMVSGSKTYANAQNALNLGLLDSMILEQTLGRVPMARGGLAMIRESARKNQANELANLLLDPVAAADALQAAGRFRINPLVGALGYRSAPVLVADQ